VGKRNHKFFACFILYSSFHAAFTFLTGLITILKGYKYFVDGEAWWINFPCWIVTIYGAMMILAMFPFASYHFWLLATGRTTNEEVRGKYDQWKGNPFDRGSCAPNCLDAFRYHPSRIFGVKGEAKVEEEPAAISKAEILESG